MTGRKIHWNYSKQARKGDHIRYISNLGKLKPHYPAWSILEEMIAAARQNLHHQGVL
jgi:hypothetical protein